MNCNGPDFKLCPIHKKIRNSSTGTSCVYVKEGNVHSENIFANDNQIWSNFIHISFIHLFYEILEKSSEISLSLARYIVDCTKRNFQDSVDYCISKGWKIASFQSDDDVIEVKGNVKCDAYLGAISDGNGKWEWIDNSPWWAYANSDGLPGIRETKIVWRAVDNKWNDWGTGAALKGVICKNAGNFLKVSSTLRLKYYLLSIN